MTKAGFGFVVAGGFIYFVASQTQIGWLYLFDAIIWSLLVLSVLFPWYSLRSLQIERQGLAALVPQPMANAVGLERLESLEIQKRR